MIYDKPNECDALDLIHYRTEHETYLNCAWPESSMRRLTEAQQVAWLRIISGPEMTRDGFPLSSLDGASDRHLKIAREYGALVAAGHLIERDGFLIAPNLVWGTPPDEELDD